MQLANMSLPKEETKLNVIFISGPGFMTQMLSTYLKSSSDPRVLIMPVWAFYPISNKHRKALTLQNYKEFIGAEVKESVYTCHLWHASWQS